jgi:hypothetical protein
VSILSKKEIKVVKLIDLDLVGTSRDALIKCLEDKSPVFIRCTEFINIWAIPKSFHLSLEVYKKLKQSNYREPFFSISNLENNLIHLSPLLMDSEILLLELKVSDIKQLIAYEELEVVEFQSVFSLTPAGGFSLVDNISTEQYFPENFMPEDFFAFNRVRPRFKFSCSSDDFNFLSCDKNKLKINEFNDPLNHKVAISIKLADCFVSENSKGKLTELQVQDIPVESVYYIPEHCRYSPKLNWLAVLGYRVYEDKSLPAPINMAKYIEKELSIQLKEANAAAFFINPEPKGDLIEELLKAEGAVQFKTLIDVSEQFYVNGKLREEKKVKAINQIIQRAFDSNYEFSAENCRSAAKLIAPQS